MTPKLIPYLIIKSISVDSLTGDSCSKYRKEYYLFNTESNKIITEHKFCDINYVDYNLQTSNALLLERKAGKVRSYAIVENAEDLENIIWFDFLEVISPDFILACKNNMYGVIDSKRTIKSFFEYQELSAFVTPSTIFLIAKKNEHYGLMDDSNNILLPFLFTSISCNNELGIFIAQNTHETIVYDIDKKTSTKLKISISNITSISEGVAIVVNEEGRYLLYDLEKNDLVTNYSYTSATPMINGFSLCSGCIIVYKNGSIYEFENEKGLSRCFDILYAINHLKDNDWEINVYKRDEKISTFVFHKDGYGVLSHALYLDKYIRLGSHNMKYEIDSSIHYYDLYGRELDSKQTDKIIEEYKEKNKKKHKNKINDPSPLLSLLEKKETLKNGEYQKFEEDYIGKTLGGDYSDVYQLTGDLYCIASVDILDAYCEICHLSYVYNGKKLWQYIRISND